MNYTISIIVVAGENLEIGYKNDLLWNIPADMRQFRKITSGHTVIMGRRTFESLRIKPLPNRRNIIMSRSGNFNYPGTEVVADIDEALQLIEPGEEVFVIGGGSIYKQFMPNTSKIYLTQVHSALPADTYFPKIDRLNWRETSRQNIDDDQIAGVKYSFVILERIQ